MPEINLVVINLNQPMRLDTYISQNQNVLTRSRLKNGVKLIQINSKTAKLSAKVNNHDVIHIDWDDPIPQDIKPENIPLSILFEDQNVTVVNKKQGVVTHPACGNWEHTLVNALLFHWNRNEIHCTESLDKVNTAKRRTGIVHRLDKDTSGIIITAKNIESEQWLQQQFRNRHVKKEYIAIVKGIPKKEKGFIKTQIIRDPKNRKRFITTDDKTKGKFSYSIYECIAVYGNYSLMKVRIKTGRTHQIRVHLKSIGCPILGDPIYSNTDKNFSSASLMLHSRKMSIRLPNEKKFSTFLAPVPIRFKKVLQKLHKLYQRTSVYIRANVK